MQEIEEITDDTGAKVDSDDDTGCFLLIGSISLSIGVGEVASRGWGWIAFGATWLVVLAFVLLQKCRK